MTEAKRVNWNLEGENEARKIEDLLPVVVDAAAVLEAGGRFCFLPILTGRWKLRKIKKECQEIETGLVPAVGTTSNRWRGIQELPTVAGLVLSCRVRKKKKVL